MNKVYIIFPLIGMLIFGGFYINFSKGYEAKLADAKAAVEVVKKAKAAQMVKDREVAIANAIESSKKREIERKERERLEEAKKTARLEAEDSRQRSYEERNKLRDQVSRLKKELEDVKAVAAKAADDKKNGLAEEAFLKDYVKKAEANVKYYYDLLDKIDAAEKARAAAEIAAAAAAKKS